MLINTVILAQQLKGGSYLVNEQDVFSFDLNESLYFEKGQEVSQMLSISLEPEISIQSFNEYVSIRGVIELHGEYEKNQVDSENDEQLLDFEDHHSRRYFEEIRSEENGLATFSHRFPVEISVPAYRVDDMDDIKVNIASFDYEILDDNQFRLISTIEIHGINNEMALPNDLNERIENESMEQNEEVLEKHFEFELKDELLHEEKNKGDDREQGSEEIEIEQKVNENDEEDIDKDRWKYKQKQSQSFEEFFKKDDDNDGEKEEVITEETDETTDLEVVDETPERKPSYLAALFSEDQSDDIVTYEQMRICIVQEQDTLESISEKYEVPKLQLLKLNRLADDDLTKGQLLTIPSKK